MARSRNWCFTSFALNIENIKNIYNDNKDIVRYLCTGKETCPSTGEMHLQGWIQFKRPKRFNGVKSLFKDNSIHIEICKGTEFDNDTYCKKDGQFVEFGEFITQGQRTDLENIQNDIKQGTKLSDIIENNFEIFCRYKNGIEKYAQIYEKKNRQKWRDVIVEVVYGDTGTGKTKYAMEQSGYKINASELNWWDGYDGEETICIDEYDNDVPITKMLNILDGYQLRLPIKGGFTYANWKRVIITSNYHPNRWHNNAKDKHQDALKRRISNIIHMI